MRGCNEDVSDFYVTPHDRIGMGFVKPTDMPARPVPIPLEPEDLAGLEEAYRQPPPDPHECPNCGGAGRLPPTDGGERGPRCEWCNPNVDDGSCGD